IEESVVVAVPDALEESVVVAVPDGLEESVAELDEPVTLLSVADAVDDALSLLEQSPRMPRIQAPALLVGAAELVTEDAEADADDVAEPDVIPALLALVDDATDEVEISVALERSVVLADDALAVEDVVSLALLVEQPMIGSPRRSTQGPDELALDEEAGSLDDEVADDGAEVADAEEDAEDEAVLDALALRDVDVAGTNAVVPGGEVELAQPCVIPRSGIQSPSAAKKEQEHRRKLPMDPDPGPPNTAEPWSDLSLTIARSVDGGNTAILARVNGGDFVLDFVEQRSAGMGGPPGRVRKGMSIRHLQDESEGEEAKRKQANRER
ncbi:hypothetical protein FOMPIDRAFT_1020919, partial [Fomitopsis schrenkii]